MSSVGVNSTTQELRPSSVSPPRRPGAIVGDTAGAAGITITSGSMRGQEPRARGRPQLEPAPPRHREEASPVDWRQARHAGPATHGFGGRRLHPSGRPVADEAHRIDRLPHPPSASRQRASGERARRPDKTLGAGDDLGRLGHAADADLAFRLSPLAGPTISTPLSRSRSRFARVAGCCHIRDHRGCDEQRPLRVREPPR